MSHEVLKLCQQQTARYELVVQSNRIPNWPPIPTDGSDSIISVRVQLVSVDDGAVHTGPLDNSNVVHTFLNCVAMVKSGVME